MTEETTDQASEQSVMERLASKFGVSDTDQTEETSEVGQETSDLAELDWDGQKYQVPMKLKDAFMKNDDYTRKTQELAEQRKSLEQVLSTAAQRQASISFNDSIQGETKELNVIEAYLAQASKADWGQMSTEQMLRQKVELDGIKERRADLQRAISDKQGKFQTELTARLADLRSKARDIASKSISNFDDTTEKAMLDFAKAEGLGETEFNNVILDPRSYKIVWKAMQFDKIQKGSSKATDAVGKVLKTGPASERMPASKVNQLNFNKAMKGAKTSSQKAQVIETRLAGMFGRK